MSDSVATASGQGTPSPAAQPAAAGQGQRGGASTAQGAGNGQAGQAGQAAAQAAQQQLNWGLFPGVPEDQRAALEPHLRGVESYVTQQQQQFAPYSPLIDILGADQVENMVGFLQQYNADPVATVLGMVRQAMEEGSLTAEQIAELSNGQQGQAANGQQPQSGQQEEIPAWARELQGRFAQFDEAMATQQQKEQEAELAQLHEQGVANIRAQLTQGGIPENLVPDETITSFIIAHNGDEQAAAQAILQMRQNFLGEFTKTTTTPGSKQPTVQGKLPQPAKPKGRRGDGFDEAKTGARQMLEQSLAASGG